MQKGQEISSEKQVVSLAQYQELQAENMYLNKELAQLKRMRFGSKSERYVTSDPGQLSLDLGMEAPLAAEPQTEEITYSRKKPEGNKGSAKRLELPSHLHREDHIIEPEEDIIEAKKIGEIVTEVLENVPGKFYVERYRRPKYVLPAEEKNVVAELPTFPIPKGITGPGLLAHLLISKFVDHLSFYRQAGQFKRQNITIAESTISGWFTAACRLLEPL